MKLTEKQEIFKTSIYEKMDRKLSFCTKNERRKKKYAWLIAAINNAKETDWTKENFEELVFFFESMDEYSSEEEELLRLWKANNFTNIF